MANNLRISMASLVLLTVILLSCLQNVDSYSVCKRKTFLQKIRFTCPEPGQASDMIYCCGDDDDIGGQYCCRSAFNLDDKTFQAFANNIGSIIATIAGILGFIIILLIICCCVCPCCLLYKRRTGGQVYRSANVPNGHQSGVNVTVVPAPGGHQQQQQQQGPPPVGFVVGGQPPGYPPQPGYPMQPTGYPQQQQPYYPPQQQAYYADQPPPYPHAGAQDPYGKPSPYNPSY